MWLAMRCMIMSSATRLCPPFEHDDVRVLAARLNVLLVHGLDGREVLCDDALERAAAVADVAQGAAQDAHVGVGLDENFNVEHIAQGRVLENEDALDDDDLGGEDLDGFVRAVVVHIGVDGALDAAARLERLEVLDEQARFKGVGMVVVDLGALLVGLAVLPLIVAVVSDDGHGVAEMLLEMARERGLAGAGAAGDADENGAHRRDILPRCLLVCLYYKKRGGKLQGRSTAGEKNSSKKGKNG